MKEDNKDASFGMTPKKQNLKLAVALAAAFACFGFLFLRAGDYFWHWLGLSVLILSSLASVFDPDRMSAALKRAQGQTGFGIVAYGVFSALMLYAIFYLGNIAARAIFPFGASDIDAVYQQGLTAPRIVVAILLLVMVGPGEEYFWRGYIQGTLADKYGNSGIAVSILAYTAVHFATGNITLILAALVCGSFWAWMYVRYNSMLINMISHGVWAATIFVLFPMT